MKNNPFTLNNWVYLLHKCCSKISPTISTEKAIFWAVDPLSDTELKHLIQNLFSKLGITAEILADFYKLNNDGLSNWIYGNDQSVYIKGRIKEFIAGCYHSNLSNRFTIPLNHVCQAWLFSNCNHPKCRYIHDNSSIIVRSSRIEAVRTGIIASGKPRVIIFIDYATGSQTLKNLTADEYLRDVYIIVFISLHQYNTSLELLKKWCHRPNFFIIRSATHNINSTFINMAFEIGHLQASLCVCPTEFWIASRHESAYDLVMQPATDIFERKVKILSKEGEVRSQLKILFTNQS